MKQTHFHDQESEFTGRYSATVKHTLWIAYRPYLGITICCFFIGLAGRLFLLANANVIGIWVDSLAGEKVPDWVQDFDSNSFLVLLSGLAILGFLNTLLFRVLFSRLSAKAVSQIYDETTMRTSRQPMVFFDSTPTGRIVTRFSSDYGNVFRLFGGPLAELFAIVFDIISMLILITLASPIYLPLVFFIGVLDYSVYRFHIQKLRQVRRNLSASRSPSIAHFAETAQGASTIRSFLKQKSFADRFKDLDQNYLDNKLIALKAMLNFSFQINCVTSIFLISTGTLAWFLLQEGYLTIGSIGVAFSFIALSGNTVQMFFEWISQFEEALVGVERMDQYLRSPLEPGARLPASSTFPTDHPIETKDKATTLSESILQNHESATVEFQNVDFQYRPYLPLVLKNLNFRIKAGEKFGVIGRTGSGKSSLIQALFHLYPLSQGKILINESDIETIDLVQYRNSMAFIAQDPALFKGYLKENLDVEGNCTEQQLFDVLTRVGLSSWANEDGLKMIIEERGRNLSLGERQLISMARCLLKNSPIVIMDEATSSVDPHTEEIMGRATEEFFRGKTQIIIAHRLTTLSNCDRILWLQNGQIKMLDTPDKVLPQFQTANLSL